MTTMVCKLHSGQAFRIELGAGQHLDYRLIHVNECRAYVEPLRKRRDTDILEDAPGGRVNITPNVECEIIDEELEAMMKPAETKSNAPKTKSEPRATRGADRKYEAKKQERPVRQGTIRANLLAAIESGKTDIPKLMKEFDMPRSLLVAHVHEFWNCHGYGYSVTGDTVKVTRPVGGVLKAEAKPVKTKTTKKKKAEKDPLADEDEDPLA